MPRCLSIVSCALTSADSTFLNFFNPQLFFLFFLFFVLTMGIVGTVDCMSNVGGGTFSWCCGLQQAPPASALLGQEHHGLPDLVPPAPLLRSPREECCAVSFVNGFGVLFVPFHVMWTCVSLLVTWPTLCTCKFCVVTLYGAWYSNSVLVSLLTTLQCCTFLFVFFGTIVLKRSNNSTAAITVRSPLEIFGTLQYTGYSAYVPVVRHPPVSLF